MVRRRWITIPLVMFATALLWLTMIVWLPIAMLVSLLPRLHGTLRFLCFITLYLTCETLGVITAAWLWLRHLAPHTESPRWTAFLAANYALQCWWARSLKRGAEFIFDLHFETSGTDALDGPPALVLPRHASIGDTVVPIVWYAAPRQFRLRYVLKKELLLDPCLDIVGNRLPNYFVDRASDDPQTEVEGVARLMRNLGDDEGVLIYPEGTRFSPKKRADVLQKLLARGDQAALERAQRWTHVLPPRLGGTLALLAANPNRDVVFCAHSGFEGSASFADLINGAWVNARIRIHFWRVPYAELPHDEESRRRWLLDQWEHMAQTVAAITVPNAIEEPTRR